MNKNIEMQASHSAAALTDDQINGVAINYAVHVAGDIYDIRRYDCAEDFYNCVRKCVEVARPSHSAAADAVPVAWEDRELPQIGRDCHSGESLAQSQVKSAEIAEWRASAIDPFERVYCLLKGCESHGLSVCDDFKDWKARLFTHPSPTTAPAEHSKFGSLEMQAMILAHASAPTATTPAASESVDNVKLTKLHSQFIENHPDRMGFTGTDAELFAWGERMNLVTPASGSIDTPEFDELMGEYLSATDGNAPAYNAIVAHINAHTAAQVAASKPAEQVCKTCGGTMVDPGGLSICRDCGQKSISSVFTYANQPLNGPAWHFGEAVSLTMKKPGGDWIDTGLQLLLELQNKGYGIVAISDVPSKPAAASGEAIPVWELYKDGWDAVEGLDSDWMTTLPFGTKLYYLPNPAPQHQVQAGGDGEMSDAEAREALIDRLSQMLDAKDEMIERGIAFSDFPEMFAALLLKLDASTPSPENAAKPVDE
jgi:hypothetical protein